MNKNEKQISNGVEQLISLKPFNELTDAEKKAVLVEVSEDEYKSLHQAAIETMEQLHQPGSSPAASIKSSLLAAYDSKYNKQRKRSVLMYSIPLYQATAAVIMTIIILAGFNYYNQKQAVTARQVVYIEKKDTVYIPARSVAVTPANNDSSNSDADDAKKGVSAPIHQTQLNYIGATHSKQKEIAGINLSRSIKQDSSLKQFMVVSSLN